MTAAARSKPCSRVSAWFYSLFYRWLFGGVQLQYSQALLSFIFLKLSEPFLNLMFRYFFALSFPARLSVYGTNPLSNSIFTSELCILTTCISLPFFFLFFKPVHIVYVHRWFVCLFFWWLWNLLPKYVSLESNWVASLLLHIVRMKAYLHGRCLLEFSHLLKFFQQ